MNSAILINVVIALLIGTLTAYLAKGRGRPPLPWFFIGVFFGIFGMIALFFFPIVQPQEPIKRESTIVVTPEPIEDALAQREWYYLDSSRSQVGPVPLGTLRELWKGKQILPTTYVWCEGMENWKKIVDLDGLAARLEI